MAKYKGSARRPQAKHKKHQQSQHDKRKRLQRRNPKRKRTTTAKVPLSGAMQTVVSVLQAVLDRRIAFRLAIVVAGMLLADDRRTASAWVEGAGIHHHPTPGPADEKWLYGHNWVALAWLATHPLWGVIAMPLRSLLYVREIDVPKLAEKYGWEFRTKHQLGGALLTWFMQSIRALGVQAKVWLAVDGAYAARPFLLPVLVLGIVVVGRLRKDACLYDLPERPAPHRRGRHPI